MYIEIAKPCEWAFVNLETCESERSENSIGPAVLKSATDQDGEKRRKVGDLVKIEIFDNISGSGKFGNIYSEWKLIQVEDPFCTSF